MNRAVIRWMSILAAVVAVPAIASAQSSKPNIVFISQEAKSPRKEFFYFSDDGDLTGLRYDNWKAVFAQQRAPGTMLVWGEPFVHTRLPWLFNLRTDPYERASITSNTYWDWYLDRVFLLMPMQSYVAKFLTTFKEYPPRQEAASFTIDQVMKQLTSPGQ